MGTKGEARDAAQRARDVEALAAFAEEVAKPIGALAATLTDGLGPFYLVIHALDAAARGYADQNVNPEYREDFEAACRIAADRIVTAWRQASARLDFRDALARATQKGGAA